MAYALIRDGAIVETADAIPDGSLKEPRAGKPYWLPLVEERPSHDANREVLDVVVAVNGKQVTITHTKRERSADELARLRAPALARVATEYRRRLVHSRQTVAALVACGVEVPKPTAREETLLAIKRAKETEVAALDTLSAIDDYDAAAGWE